MRLLNVSLFPLIVSVLAGCSLLPEAEQRCTWSANGYVQTCTGTPQPNSESSRRQVAEYERARQLAAQIRSDADRQCAGYGFVSGTTPFAQCVMQIDTAKRAAVETMQQAQRQRDQRYSQCKRVESQAWLSSGPNFFESLPQVKAAFDNCMAGIPPPPKLEVFCSRIGRDEVRCSSR
jgi:hypothetical protein